MPATLINSALSELCNETNKKQRPQARPGKSRLRHRHSPLANRTHSPGTIDLSSAQTAKKSKAKVDKTKPLSQVDELHAHGCRRGAGLPSVVQVALTSVTAAAEPRVHVRDWTLGVCG